MDKARTAIFKESTEPDGVEVRGYDFSKGFDLRKFLDSYKTTGFQGTHLGQGIELLREMQKERKKNPGMKIFLGYTSNMVSSGLREVIAYLVKEKMVDVLVTTAGGIEEDVIKTLKPFILGEWNVDGKKLRESGVNRIGNIFVPNDRYIAFEKLMNPFFQRLHGLQKQGEKISASRFCFELGKQVKNEHSILYWATKHGIPVFCPAITDGSIGDMLYFYLKKNPDFVIDVAADIVKINDIALNADKTGVIVLGGGLAKHHVINANLFREGADYAVYVSTGSEGDGSIAGAKPEEAKSWGKLQGEAMAVHIEGDATIIFPLMVAGLMEK